MPRRDVQPSEDMRPGAGADFEHNGDDNPEGLRPDVSGEPRRTLRTGEPRLASLVRTAGREDAPSRTLSRGRGRSSGSWRADGDAFGDGGGGGDKAGFRFNLKVDRDGYAWWYVDALSDDGAAGLTIIAFIGSVFSPYYAWSKARDPFEHCAINVALYGANANRWAMTERPRKLASIERDHFLIGGSSLSRAGESLIIDIDEPTVPFPSRVKGKVRLKPAFINSRIFDIEPGGRHRWRPIAPAARVEVEFVKPALRWTGDGYFDSNFGAEALEKRFRRWDWARMASPDARIKIVYDAETFEGSNTSLSLLFDRRGDVILIPYPTRKPGPPTRIWRMPRTFAWDAGPVRATKTLEDAPFYSRSTIEAEHEGKLWRGVHESFSGERLRSPIVKTMLGFRMLRLSGYPPSPAIE